MPTLEALADTPWLCRVGEPTGGARTLGSTLEELAARFEEEPDQFLAPPYAEPYQSMCAEDHAEASRLAAIGPSVEAEEAARGAYLAAWERVPVPEICGLVSDDVHTLATLLARGAPLRAFTRDRLEWYRRGRVPWGYDGAYPNGRWVVL